MNKAYIIDIKDYLEVPENEIRALGLNSKSEFRKLVKRPFRELLKMAGEGDIIAQTIVGLACQHKSPPDHKNAVEFYKAAANKGNLFAQTQLGTCYQEGLGVAQDYDQAFYWFEKSARQGYAGAMFDLSQCYLEGLGTPRDHQKGLLWLEEAAKEGEAAAQFELGILYYNGETISKNLKKSLKYLVKAGNQGLDLAQLMLGQHYLAIKERYWGKKQIHYNKKAFSWFEKAAKQGQETAQYTLGICYKDGIGVPINLKESIEWLKRSAELQNSDAQYHLACNFQEVNDNEQYMYWLQQAAENGNIKAQFDLWDRLIEKDLNSSVNWLKKAAEGGHKLGQFYLGLSYDSGLEIKKDNDLAEYWLTKSSASENGVFTTLSGGIVTRNIAENAFQSPYYHAGNNYASGTYVFKDPDKAMYWFYKSFEFKELHAISAKSNQQSAKDGDIENQYLLAYRYFEGDGVLQDDDEALFWLKTSAHNGYSQAQYKLGLIYIDGIKMPKNYSKALHWLNQAAENENDSAQFKLAELYEKGEVAPFNPDKAAYWRARAATHRSELLGTFSSFDSDDLTS